MNKGEFSVLKGRHILARGNAPGGGKGLKFVREMSFDSVPSTIRTKWSIPDLLENHSLNSVRTSDFRFTDFVFADGINPYFIT